MNMNIGSHRDESVSTNPNSLHMQFFQDDPDQIAPVHLDPTSMIVNRVTINTLEEQLTNSKIFEDNQDNDESDKYSEDKLDPIAFSIRNRKFKAELTPDERGYIIGRSVSTSVQELAKELKLSRSTIQHTLKMCRQRKHNKTLNQNRGRKLAISPEEMERVLKLIEQRPGISKQEIISSLDLKVSSRTLARALQRNGTKRLTLRNHGKQ